MKKKRLLLIYAKSSLELLNRQSALGSYIFCLCQLLQESGKEVFVNGINFKELKQTEASVVLSRNTSGSGFKRYIPKVVKELIKDIFVFRNINQLHKNIAASGKYDCILEFYNYASNIGMKISKEQKIPLVLVYDAPVLEEYMFFHGNKYFFKNVIAARERETLLCANKIVAYSNSVKKFLIKIAGKELNVSIHQNVDFTRFHFLEKTFSGKPIKIGFIGSFLKWHRIDLLVNAFNKLRKEDYPVELYLIGNGMEYPLIKEQVEQSEYKEFVTMPGYMDGEQLLEMKKQLHIGMMPGSNWYGAPNKIFEYGAAMMAVVAPKTPTIADLFENNKEVLLFEQDNAEELFGKLKQLCDDMSFCEQFAKHLQQKIKSNYSAENTSEFYMRLLEGTV